MATQHSTPASADAGKTIMMSMVDWLALPQSLKMVDDAGVRFAQATVNRRQAFVPVTFATH